MATVSVKGLKTRYCVVWHCDMLWSADNCVLSDTAEHHRYVQEQFNEIMETEAM